MRLGTLCYQCRSKWQKLQIEGDNALFQQPAA
jgi:hypothetical protein